MAASTQQPPPEPDGGRRETPQPLTVADRQHRSPLAGVRWVARTPGGG
ncbi:hypothetical protein JOE57_002968 [Microlunatus panaciterrae]|uniref:Uncharacterized protein n=1 Tax=Microlunatus panaciterrae TaxID=400768 RepID=A0ABS2RNI4_9ACTN|nr:hypothetical protein [Microlunatus panaciterrae]